MDLIQQWKPTVALSHAEGCVLNAVISPQLAQEIFRQVTDELNGIGEGPKVEAGDPLHVRECKTCQWDMRNIPGKNYPIGACDHPEFEEFKGKRPCPEWVSRTSPIVKGHPEYKPVTKARDPEEPMKEYAPDEPSKPPVYEGPPKTMAISMETKALPLCSCGCGKPVTKQTNKYLHGHSGSMGSGRASTGGERPICKNCGSEGVRKDGINELKNGGRSQRWRCMDCKKGVCIKIEESKSAPEQSKPESKRKLATGELAPDNNLVVIGQYKDLKKDEVTLDDLLIIEGTVLCPKEGKAVTASDCTPCNSYVCTFKAEGTDEPHIRCTKAGAS